MLDSIRILTNVNSQNSFDVAATMDIRADSYPVDFYVQLYQSDHNLPYTPSATATVSIQFLRMDSIAAVPVSQSQIIEAEAPFADKSIWKVTLYKENVQKITTGGFRVVVSDTLPAKVTNIAGAGVPGASRSTSTVTITTVEPHELRQGETVQVAGVSNVSFNGTFLIVSVPSPVTFTYQQVAVNQTSGGGTVQNANPEEFQRSLFSRMSIRKIPADQSPLNPDVS